MSIRDALEKNRTATIIVAVVVLGVCSYWLMRSGATVTPQSYYYDIGAGDLFGADASLPSPTDAPSGSGNGMRAHVFTCGKCTEQQRKITYIERMTPEAQQMAATFTPTGDPDDELEYQRVMGEGHHVAAPPADGKQPQWVSIVSPEGQALTNAHLKMCGESVRPTACSP